MPNWLEIVRQRLSELELDALEKEEVHAEFASHLEESYEMLCKQGLVESEAARRTLEQVSDWQELRREVSAAKRREHPMKKRLQQLWIPGFLTLILSMLFLMLLQKAGFRPRIAGSGPSTILFYVPWLAVLPFIGALGAYLSSRSGGTRGTMMLASIFPALSLLAAFLLMFPIGMVVERATGNHVDFGIVAAALLSSWIGWIVAPGCALILGGLVVSVLFRRRPLSQDTAIGNEMTHA